MSDGSGARYSGGGISGWQGPLAEGETILWQGQPAAGFAFRRGDLVSFAIAGYFLYASLSRPEQTGGLTYVLGLISLMLLAEIFLLRPWSNRHMRYVLTNRRAIILRRCFGKTRQEDYPLADMTLISLARGSGATGSIGFAEALSWSTTRTIRIIGFERLPDAASVHKMMLAAKDALTAKAADAPKPEAAHG